MNGKEKKIQPFCGLKYKAENGHDKMLQHFSFGLIAPVWIHVHAYTYVNIAAEQQSSHHNQHTPSVWISLREVNYTKTTYTRSDSYSFFPKRSFTV